MGVKRTFCPQCKGKIVQKLFEDRYRDFCQSCGTVFYDNPLPVVSAVIVNPKREVLLVLREREPKKDLWSLPSGFAELDETIEEAVLREVKEETGIKGKVVRLLDAQSFFNEYYGDLIWISYEVKWVSGSIVPGDDAADAKFFSIFSLPKLAFSTNDQAIEQYLLRYRDLWTMHDSFRRIEGGKTGKDHEMPSDSLFEIIMHDTPAIIENWVSDVVTHRTTRHYSLQSKHEIYQKAVTIIYEFGQWIKRPESKSRKIWEYFRKIGKERRKEGYKLSEVISALSLIRKHIFAHVFAQGGVWEKPIEMYRSMEFMSRVNLFFDKANYYVVRGYENVNSRLKK